MWNNDDRSQDCVYPATPDARKDFGPESRQYPAYTRVSMGRIEDIEVFQRVFTEVFNA
jgi:hypothetical protein